MSPRFVIYQVICERLEAIDHVTDAVACFHEMSSELEQEMEGGEAGWILGK